jgi:crotonobetainyl-CoA:carnitine CoA-transferase CaiB-like acyl-CoA transferase
VNDLPQALESPFVRETGMIRTVPHPLRQNLRVLASPIKIDGVRPEQKPAPLAGADNEALVGGAGRDTETGGSSSE